MNTVVTKRKWLPKGLALIIRICDFVEVGMALLEKLCHYWGMGFEVSYAQTTANVTSFCLRIKIYSSALQ